MYFGYYYYNRRMVCSPAALLSKVDCIIRATSSASELFANESWEESCRLRLGWIIVLCGSTTCFRMLGNNYVETDWWRAVGAPLLYKCSVTTWLFASGTVSQALISSAN